MYYQVLIIVYSLKSHNQVTPNIIYIINDYFVLLTLYYLLLIHISLKQLKKLYPQILNILRD